MMRVVRRLLWITVTFAAIFAGLMALIAAAIAGSSTLYRPVPSDAIVVLGAAVWPGPRPSPALKGRVERAAQLYKAGFAPHVVTTGGSAGNLPSEAEIAASVLLEYGVPESAILIESQATSTEESARYVSQMLRARGWSSLVVVSDGYHLTRSLWLFRKEGIATSAAAADDWYYSTGDRIYHLLRESAALSYLVLRDLYGAATGIRNAVKW
jgi:uncharacterized SAM-binding protein YcdF (DUF218 family)